MYANGLCQCSVEDNEFQGSDSYSSESVGLACGLSEHRHSEHASWFKSLGPGRPQLGMQWFVSRPPRRSTDFCITDSA